MGILVYLFKFFYGYYKENVILELVVDEGALIWIMLLDIDFDSNLPLCFLNLLVYFQGEYSTILNDYARAKSLFKDTEVPLFKEG